VLVGISTRAPCGLAAQDERDYSARDRKADRSSIPTATPSHDHNLDRDQWLLSGENPVHAEPVEA
jgi:hypothetical protein